MNEEKWRLSRDFLIQDGSRGFVFGRVANSETMETSVKFKRSSTHRPYPPWRGDKEVGDKEVGEGPVS